MHHLQVNQRPRSDLIAHRPKCHIAIQEQLDGKAVDWLEKVTDEQYGAGRGPLKVKIELVEEEEMKRS